MKKLNRRDLFKVGAGSMLSTYGLQSLGSTTPYDEYRALVCVFLVGGNDGFNMVVPRSISEYNAYARSRQNLKVARNDLLPIQALTTDGAQYGLHPSMSTMQNLFENGNAAIINNVGPLIRPISKGEFVPSASHIPPKLFSHNSQRDQWSSLTGHAPATSGWAGRIADFMEPYYLNQKVATNISVAGNHLSMVGRETQPFAIGRRGPKPYQGLDKFGSNPALRQAFMQILAAGQGNLYERSFAQTQQRALHVADAIDTAMQNAPPLNTVFPESDLGTKLNSVARIINARKELQMQRQIFIVSIRGFDTHSSQNDKQPGLFADVSESIDAFYNATMELGIADNVTTFTQSDFGRTLTSNGDGTDHGWGNNHMVIGGSVRGKDLYGTYPVLEMNGPDEINGGRIIPTTSASQYTATLAKWFGVPDSYIADIAPNIGNFNVQNLGFMS
jgi:uncharacterized protein (DUF1501 family)